MYSFHHKKNKLNFKNQKGVGLIEVLIVFSVVIILTSYIYVNYAKTSAQEKAFSESKSLIELTNSTLRVFSSSGNFSSISPNMLIESGLVPPNLDLGDVGGQRKITSILGSELEVASATYDGRPDSVIRFTYQDVPQKSCHHFVLAASQGFNFRDIHINNQSVFNNQRLVDPSNILNICHQSNSSDISFFAQHISQAGTPLIASEDCVVPTPSSEDRNTNCPSGYLGTIVERRNAICPAGATLPVWSDWVEISNTCQQVCEPHPSSPETRTTTPCPAGQIGTITEKRESICPPSGVGSPVWGDWAVVSNTCAAQCIPHADEVLLEACPAGYSGEIKKKRSSACPNPTGSPVWGDWVVVSNTCAPNCVVPSPNYESRWLSANKSCPPGESGYISYEKEQKRYASCASPTSQVTWSGWTDTGVIRNENTSNCVPNCVPDSPLERWVDKEDMLCPQGTVGKRKYQLKEVRTSYCPSNVGSPITSQWKLSNPTEIRNLVTDCKPIGCTIPAQKVFKWKHGAGTSGNYECQYINPTKKVLNNGETIKLAGTVRVDITNSEFYSNTSFVASGSAEYSCNGGVLSVTPVNNTCQPLLCEIKPKAIHNWYTTGELCVGSPITLQSQYSINDIVTFKNNVPRREGRDFGRCVVENSPMGMIARLKRISISSYCYRTN